MDEERSPLLARDVETVGLEEAEGCARRLADPSRKFYRYFALFFICMLTFGQYFCYVLPGALEKEIERDLKITTTQFTVFTSLYSWPNVIFCFLGGYLIDKVLGIRLGALIFACLITFGQILFGYAAYVDNLILMDIGRFIFGMAGESVAVAQKAYAVAWYSSSELNLVFGVLTSAALLGSSINQLVMSPIYDYVGNFETGYRCLGLSILLASLTCVFSALCSFVLVPLDKRRQRFLKQQSETEQKAEEKIQLKDAIHFPSQLWIIIAICVVFYSATFPFISLGKLFFIRKYNFSSQIASLQQSLFFFVTVITSPIFGFLVDRTGFNVFWVIASLVMAIASHALFMFTFVNAFVPVLLLGSSLSLMAVSLWPMVSIIIPKHQLATAFGLMQSIQNLGLAVFSILTGVLLQNSGYFVLELFFLGLCWFGLMSAIVLYFVDRAKGGHLCQSKMALSVKSIN